MHKNSIPKTFFILVAMMLIFFPVLAGGNLSKVNALSGDETIVIGIDVKPDSDPNYVNVKENGVIPVAILSTENFDATQVDDSTLRFGPEGAKISHKKGHYEDVDFDGDIDLLLHFSIQESGIKCGSISVYLKGYTILGQAIYGADFIETLGCETDQTTIIPDSTKVLSFETTQYLEEISSNLEFFTFSQATPELINITTGDIIVGDVSPFTPYGFLRKVVSKSYLGDKVILKTISATLEDAIEDGKLSESITLTPGDIQSHIMSNGVALDVRNGKVAKLTPVFNYVIDNLVLYDLDDDLETTNDQVVANGFVTVETGFDFDFVIDDHQLELLAFTNTTTETSNLEVEADFAYSISEEKEIARHKFQPITFFVGSFPVVIVPEMTVTVGVDGDLHINIVTSVDQSASLTSGIQYTSIDGWSPVYEFTNNFQYYPPVLTAATLNVKGYATGGLELKLYNVSGPHANVTEYLLLEADVYQTPWWTLYGGLDVVMGIKVELFSTTLVDQDFDLLNYKVVLAQAQVPPPAPSAPTNLNAVTVSEHEIYLEWTDNSDETNFSIERSPNGIDGWIEVALVSSNISSYQDSSLNCDTQYYYRVRAYRAGDNEYSAYSNVADTTTQTCTSSEYPLIENFNSSNGFTSTDPDLYIQNGRAYWHVYRSGGSQFIYRDIPEFSGPVRLTVTGQINYAANNCHVDVGVGDDLGLGVDVSYGYFGGGCPVRGYVIRAGGVDLNFSTHTCTYGTASDWFWINRNQDYTITLTVDDNALLEVPGVGSVTGSPVYTGPYNKLYVGLNGGGDWPDCYGTIDQVIVEPLP